MRTQATDGDYRIHDPAARADPGVGDRVHRRRRAGRGHADRHPAAQAAPVAARSAAGRGRRLQGDRRSDVSARRAKLVCTIGPATVDRVDELVAAGMDVARVNFSHGTPEAHARAAHAVRAAAAAAVERSPSSSTCRARRSGSATSTADAATLAAGRRVRCCVRERRAAGDRRRRPRLLRRARRRRAAGRPHPARRWRGRAARRREPMTMVETEVVRGGTIRSHAGVNVPAERLSGPRLTERDRARRPARRRSSAPTTSPSRSCDAPSDVAELRELARARRSGRSSPRSRRAPRSTTSTPSATRPMR